MTLARLMNRAFAPTWAIFVISMIAAASAGWLVDRRSDAVAEERFRLNSTRIVGVIRDAIDSYEPLLRAGSGLISVRPDATPDEWAKFVGNLKLERTLPGVQGFGFAAVLGPAQIANHEKKQRQFDNQYAVWPNGERDTYAVITMLQPAEWRNKRAIGFDMFSETNRRVAMEAARDTGAPRMTKAVTLVQETADQRQHGVLIYLPVYRGGSTPPTEERRRAEITGYSYLAVRMGDMFERVVRAQLADLLSLVSVRVVDGPDSDIQLFQSSQTAAPDVPAGLKNSAQLSNLGRSWRVDTAALSTFRTPAELQEGWRVFALAALLGMLATAIAYVMALSRERDVEARKALEVEIETRKDAQRALELANRDVVISNQELIHRVKNMMSVVTSIATQTARYSPNPEEFSASFRERLAALGRAQDLLKPHPGHMPDFKDLIRQLLTPYRAPGDAALVMEGPSVRITQSMATMLSLVLNELASNAMRFGAWSKQDGKVSIYWKTRPANPDDKDDQECLELQWVESGGPEVTQPTRRGFGSNVLKFSIEQGLRGSYEARYLASGLSCRFSVPLPARPHPSGVPNRTF